MYIDFEVGSTLTNQFLPSVNPAAPAKTGVIFGQRKLPAGNTLVKPVGDTSMPPLYQLIKLPAYKDGLSALAQLAKYGFNYTLGLSYDTEYVAPSKVTVNTSTGLTTLEWNSPVMGIQNLIGQNPSGSISQGTSKAAIRGVSIVGSASFMVVEPVSAAIFNTTAKIDVFATLNKQVPNPKTSDSICVAVYGYYEQYKPSPKFTTSPECYISVSVSGRDTSISPTGTPIDLVAPTSITAVDGKVYLTYPITADNLGLLPVNYLGDTIVKQGAITALYNGYTLTATECIIEVVNPSAEFVPATPITVTLDVSKSGFAYTGNIELPAYALGGWDVRSVAQLNADHPAFVAGIEALNAPEAYKHRKYKVQGYFGFHFTQVNQYPLSAFTAPDSTNYAASITLDIPTVYQFSAVGINAVQHMFTDLNNEAPYFANSGTGSLVAQECSTNQSSLPTNDMANQLGGQGWTVFMPNEVGSRYIYNNINCMQTNAGRQDLEYRFQATMLKVRWVDKNLVEVGNATLMNPDGTRKNNDPETLTSLQQNLMNVLTVGKKDLKMLGGNQSITLSANPLDVSRINVESRTAVVSPSGGMDITAVFESYTL